MAVVEYGKTPVDVSKGIFDYWGLGSPATSLVNAVAGSLYRQLDGGSGSMTWQRTTAGWEKLATPTSTPWSSITGTPTTIAGYGITDFNSLGDARWLGIGAAAASVAWANITSKPTTIAGFGITDFNSLGDARWSLLGHTHTFASLTSKPTTIAGYGIADAVFAGVAMSGVTTFTATSVISGGNRIVSTVGSAVLGRQGIFQSDVQGNALWWGHANTDYKNTLGSYNSAGWPYIAFFAYQDTGDVFKRSGSTTYPFQIRAEATGQVLNFMYAGLSTADSAITWTSGMSLGAGVLTVASNLIAGGPVFGDAYFSGRTGGVEKVYYGVAQSTNHIITGSITGDAVLRAVTSGARFLFSVDNGSSGTFIIGDGWYQQKPATATAATYSHWQNTGGDYYLGVDNSAASAFGFGAYGFGLYSPAGVAWFVNKASNVMSFSQIPFIAVSGVTARPVASYIISTAAPTTETAPEGTIWIQT